MYRRYQQIHVSFPWTFEDESGEEIECVITGTCTPEEPMKITADPYYSHDGSPAEFEITNIKSVQRELTDSEYEMLLQNNAVEVKAFEEADAQLEYA